jgi:hypothetical protein
MEISGLSSNDFRALFEEKTSWVCSIGKLYKSLFLFCHILSLKRPTASYPELWEKFSIVFLHLSQILFPLWILGTLFIILSSTDLRIFLEPALLMSFQGIATQLLTHSLTHGAEPFLRSYQLCSCSRISQHFMEPGGSLPCLRDYNSVLKHEVLLTCTICTHFKFGKNKNEFSTHSNHYRIFHTRKYSLTLLASCMSWKTGLSNDVVQHVCAGHIMTHHA